MNQFHASGKSSFISFLKKKLKFQTREILQSKELLEEEKKAAILKLKLNFYKKVNHSKISNF
jgi:hypothetical protein